MKNGPFYFNFIKLRIGIVEQEPPVFQLICKSMGLQFIGLTLCQFEMAIVYITENNFPFSKFDA
jgi:hypothetical protein